MANDPVSSDRVRAAWDTNAAFWDERMGEGNTFHLQLVEPAMLQQLEIRGSEQILEIACGNGQFARKLTSLGANVLATDFSPNMVERARAHKEPFNDQIEYRVVDATADAELRGIGANAFDAVVSNMALMDMSDLTPLFQAVPQLLKAGGRFVFSTMHPCFNSNNPTFFAENTDDGGALVQVRGLKLTRYLDSFSFQGLALINQPMPQYYFHRPLSALLGEAFRAGLVVDGLLEPRLPADQSSPCWSSWLNYHEFPPLLVARCRVSK